MATSVVMPALEMAQETGKVVSWLKREGEQVAKGEPLLEIETDKAVVEIEASADGLLGGVCAAVGDVVPVGQTIAWLLAPGEAVPTAESVAPSARRTDQPAPAAPGAGAKATPTFGRDVKVSPKARRLAAERGVDLRTIRGTGPGGEILTADVLGAAAADAGTSVGQASESGAVGRLMAERTTASWTSVPHFFVVRELDATGLLAYHQAHRAEFGRSRNVKVTLTDLFVAIAARAVRKHARMNASWVDNGVRLNADVNVALAIATPDGVVAPVIHKADTLGLAEIATRRLDLAARAQERRLQPPDLVGGTFAISNLGMYEVDAFTAIIVPPQAAILAIGAIADRVIAVDGRPAVRPTATLTLSADHRVVDGARAAMFMQELCAMLRDPGRHQD
jgi:pyruvate dehydrogenase E2 component (dihydrolipoamide acetyltransferase)